MKLTMPRYSDNSGDSVFDGAGRISDTIVAAATTFSLQAGQESAALFQDIPAGGRPAIIRYATDFARLDTATDQQKTAVGKSKRIKILPTSSGRTINFEPVGVAITEFPSLVQDGSDPPNTIGELFCFPYLDGADLSETADGVVDKDLIPKNVPGTSPQRKANLGSESEEFNEVFADAVTVGGKKLGLAAANPDIIIPTPVGATSQEKTLALQSDIPTDQAVFEGGVTVRPALSSPQNPYPYAGGNYGDLTTIVEFPEGGGEGNDIVLFSPTHEGFGFITNSAGAALIDADTADGEITGANFYFRPDNNPTHFSLTNVELRTAAGGKFLSYQRPAAQQQISIFNSALTLREELTLVTRNRANAGGMLKGILSAHSIAAGNVNAARKLSVFGAFDYNNIRQPLNNMAAGNYDPEGDADAAGINDNNRATPAAGYSVGSQWVNTTNKSRWICTSVSGADATWERVGAQTAQIFNSAGGVSSGSHDLIDGFSFSDFSLLNFVGYFAGHSGNAYRTAVVAVDFFDGGNTINFGDDGTLPSSGATGLKIRRTGASEFSISSSNISLRRIYGIY